MGASTIATGNSRRRLKSTLSTTTSAELRSLLVGSVQLNTDVGTVPYRKSAGNLFPTLAGLTFGDHYIKLVVLIFLLF